MPRALCKRYVALVAFTPLAAQAAEVYWVGDQNNPPYFTQEHGAPFADGSFYFNGLPPAAGDTVEFGMGSVVDPNPPNGNVTYLPSAIHFGTYTVVNPYTLASTTTPGGVPYSIQSFNVGSGSFTFDFAGGESLFGGEDLTSIGSLATTGTTFNTIGTAFDGNPHTASLTLLHGVLTASNVTAIGSGAGVVGTLTVTGSDARFNSSAAAIQLGLNGGTGQLSIQSGATVLADSVKLGVGGSSASGTVNLVASDSTLQVKGANGMSVGADAGTTGNLNVSGHAVVTVSTGDLFIGRGGSGVLSIAGANVKVPNGSVHFGSSTNATGTGTISSAGASLTAGGTLILGDTGAGSLSITTGAAGRFGHVIVGTGGGASGTLTVDGTGTSLICDNDFNLGSGGGLATLALTNGAFTSAGSLTAVAGGTIRVSASTLNATATANNGSLVQTGGATNLGPLTGGGSLSVTGDASGDAVATVASFAQNAVTVGDGGMLNVLSNSATFTNTATSLTISGSGTVDLANHRLITQSPAATVRQYLVSAYAGNNWTGQGITSSFVASNNSGTVKKYALGYAAAGQLNVVPTIPANSVLVRPTLFGDTNLDGKVDNADISAIIAAGHYLDGTSNNSWAVGDWNYDGKVDNNDISNLIASGNYLSGQTVNGASASAKLTAAASITAAVGTVGTSGDGIPDYVYDPSTGDVKFRTDGVSGAVQEVHLRSVSNPLQPQNMTDSGIGLDGVDVTTAAEIDLFRQGSLGGTLRQFPDGYDFNNILPAGLTMTSLLQDLTLTYTTNGGGVSNMAATLIYGSAGVPEPAAVALAGFAVPGLIRRPRRRRRRPSRQQ